MQLCHGPRRVFPSFMSWLLVSVPFGSTMVVGECHWGTARERTSAPRFGAHPRPGRVKATSEPTAGLPGNLGDKELGQDVEEEVEKGKDEQEGEEALASFREGFEAAGGEVIKELFVPFPNVEFQAILTEVAALKPDAVACFFAGGGAVKFVKDYAAAGLKSSIPLYGSGFLTEGVLDAQGDAAEGITTTLHYADGLQNPKNLAFREAYRLAYSEEADVYAVQGYDAGLLLIKALQETSGDLSKKAQAINAMEGAKIDSPRGPWTMSRAHNPIQNFYTVKVNNGVNSVVGTAWEGLEDPAVGCDL